MTLRTRSYSKAEEMIRISFVAENKDDTGNIPEDGKQSLTDEPDSILRTSNVETKLRDGFQNFQL